MNDKFLLIKWEANKVDGQIKGNMQLLRKPTLNDYNNRILPLLNKKMNYTSFLENNPETIISLINQGKGWRLNKVDDWDNFIDNLEAGLINGWIIEIISNFNPVTKEE